jgi:glycosyltransferase involved in cell wall biosynthesis
MKPIKLAWDNCFPRRNPTGSGVYASRLLENLTGNPELDLNVFDGWPDSSGEAGRLGRMLRVGGNLIWTHFDLPFRLWKGGFDVLHSPAFIAPVKAPCPTVITIHDITYLLYPAHFAAWWVRYMKTVMPIAIRSAAAILCGSEHSKRDLVATYKLPPAKVHAIAYGVDHGRFCPGAVMNVAWARQVGIHGQYVLHVGGFYERKNVPALLRAVAQLRARGKWRDRQLVLAGAEAPGFVGAAEIHRTIAELGLTPHVVLPGRVPDDLLPGLYANAALVAMPSLYEGFGFPIVEGMAAGTPVVASNTSSLPEVAGEAAVLVPPQDIDALAEAIGEVLENAQLRAELRARGLERAQEFSWKRTAEETIAVYRSVAG